MLAYLPQRVMEIPADVDIPIEVVGFSKDGRWGHHGKASLKSVYMEGTCLMLAQVPTGAESDNVTIPADEQSISTLETIFCEVTDHIAMRYDVYHLKN